MTALPPFQRTQELDDLVTAMTDLRPLAMVGAGASIASGYPSWKVLLGRMEERLMRESPQAPKLSGVLRELNDVAWQAEELEHLLTEATFHQFIQETFGEPQPPNSVAEPHHLIATLGFRHVLTTNYDPCIKLAPDRAGRVHKVLDWSKTEDAQDFFRSLSNPNAQPCIVHLHGHFSRPADVVLTERSYARLYLNDRFFQQRLLAIFMTQSVVFIGFSMDDPDLGYLMRLVRQTLGTDCAQHFGIFGYRTTDERELIARRMQNKYGLKAVFYRVHEDGPGKEDHTALLDLLEHLGGAIGKAAPQAGRVELTDARDRTEITRSPDSKSLYLAGIRPERSTPEDAADPHKGRFGGLSVQNGRRLYVTDIEEVKKGSYMAFTLVVEATPGFLPLKGVVRFQLHPTFAKNDYKESVVEGKATSRIGACYGAFTVGVTITDENTQLELDLSQLEEFPIWFRER